jgi:site-specific DNA-cytosine methylase
MRHIDLFSGMGGFSYVVIRIFNAIKGYDRTKNTK